MTSSLRARALMLAAVLAAIAAVVPAAPSVAAGSDPPLSTHDLQITPVGVGTESAADGRVSAVLDPGLSAVRSFVIANRTSGLRLTVRLAAVDAKASSDGSVRFAKDASKSGPASWLTLSDVVATLEPHAEVRVSLTIAPPGNAEPGSVFAGVVARVDHSVRMADGADGPKSDPISLPVAIQAKGAATALVSIVGVQAVKDHDRSYLELTFQNGGATANTMAGSLKVSGPHPKTFDLRVHVAPLTHTTERVEYDMPSGAQTVPVSVDTQDSGGNQAAWSGKVGFDAAPARTPASSRATHANRVAPATGGQPGLLSRALAVLVVLTLAAGALWFGAELRRNRRGRGPRDAARVGVRGDPARVRRFRRPLVTPIPIPSMLPEPAPEPASAVARPRRAAARAGRGRGACGRRRFGRGAARSTGARDRPARGAARRALSRRHRVHDSVAETGRGTRLHRRAAVARAESGAILYAAAAPEAQVAAFDAPSFDPPSFDPPGFDPYDWPTEAQLDEFIAKRNSRTTDPR